MSVSQYMRRRIHVICRLMSDSIRQDVLKYSSSQASKQ